MLCFRFVLIFLSVIGIVANQHSTADEMIPSLDWPQWRGPNRDNISSSKGIATDWENHPPTLDWKVEGIGEGYASVSIVGDRLYTTGNVESGQTVFAVNMKSRRIEWSTPLTDSKPKHGYEGSRCTPTISGDRVYAITSNGQIACLKIGDGSIVWKKVFQDEWDGKMMSGWGFSESPLVDGDWVLCTPGSESAMIVCLDKNTGDLVWKSAVPDEGQSGNQGAGYSVMTISEAGGIKQYVQLIGRGLIGVRASDGKHLWSYNRIANPVADIPTPIVRGDYVFGSTGYGEGGSALLKVSRQAEKVSAEEVYYRTAKELQNHHGGMVLVGDYLYFGNGHNNGFPVCIEFLTGKSMWGDKIRGAGSGSAAVTYVDGHVIFRYQSGQVALIEANPASYRLKGSFTPEVQIKESWAQPVVVGGKLYLREQNTLMCYSLMPK